MTGDVKLGEVRMSYQEWLSAGGPRLEQFDGRGTDPVRVVASVMCEPERAGEVAESMRVAMAAAGLHGTVRAARADP